MYSASSAIFYLTDKVMILETGNLMVKIPITTIYGESILLNLPIFFNEFFTIAFIILYDISLANPLRNKSKHYKRG